MVGQRRLENDPSSDLTALDKEFSDSEERRSGEVGEGEGNYALLQPRAPEAQEVKVELPWKKIRKDHPKMQAKTKTSRRDSTCYIFTLKFLRFLCFFFSFFLILGSSVMSKLSLTLLSYQNKPNRTMELCVQTPNKLFTVVTSPLERLAWSWSLWFLLLIPEVFVFLESCWIFFFKKAKFPNLRSFCAVFLGETLHTIGICLLVFEVIPSLDAIRGVMLFNGLCFIPGCLSLLSRDKFEDYFHWKLAADMVCLVGILAGSILWAWEERMWILPITGILVSCNWWENYVSKDSPASFVITLVKCKNHLQKHNRRNSAYLLVSLWKILMTFLALIIHLVVHSTGPGDHLLDYLGYFSSAFKEQPVGLIQAWRTSSSTLTGNEGQFLTSWAYLPVYILLFQAGCSLLCYLISAFACRIGIQEFSFSLALMISTPIAVFLSSSACSWRAEDPCFLTNLFPEYVYWQCPLHGFFDTFLTFQHGWVWIFWFVSQIWLTSHIWAPARNNDSLFVVPMYSGAIVEQSLVNNRVNRPIKSEEASLGPRSNTIIYGCATMWHESKEEMRDLMKSVMRMDKELQKERLKIEKLEVRVERMKYNFRFETHIFFDDAFTIKKVGERHIRVVNKYVKDFVESKFNAEKGIYGRDGVIMGLKPDIYVTPYGGRLEWTLPGQSKVYVHLKDKALIKIKKRWSQVMYMFYLLGYLMLDPKEMFYRHKAEENTFILALDGDVDFKPDAIQKLLDLMQMNPELGAACGRIHPVGQGLIPWYQRFEYAIGHWLQKATEHVTGCVLCSPGCFSLFRAEALLKVMETYSQNAQKPKEFVQFDLGEDRWLCTLLLKQGYRIEYSAASDAFTRCPESFEDFYKQRRRWGPSTMVNIMDILTGWKDTVRVNKNISTLYILYTGLIMAGTILGPGTIFLMVTGSISAAFQVSNLTALWANLIPITIFILICFFTIDKIQILFAGILSTLYALLMMAVLIGVIIQLQEDGVTSPTGLFLIALASSFVIAAIAHPQEFHCLKHGILYFLLVPSMYLLLTLYSLINMNDVSWGTRETAKTDKKEGEATAEGEKGTADQQLATNQNDKSSTTKTPEESYWANFAKYFGPSQNRREDSVASRLCSCFICSQDHEDEATKQLLHKVEIMVEDTKKSIYHMERFRTPGLASPGVFRDKQYFPPSLGANQALDPVPENVYGNAEDTNPVEKEAKPEDKKDGEVEEDPEVVRQRELWTKAKVFKDCEVFYLEYEEETFWKEMIKDYLTPVKPPEDEEKKAEEDKQARNDLRDMRNNYIFAFFMLNGLFILVIFLLQLNKETLYIIWPINAKTNLTYIPVSSVVKIDYEYLHLEPFGFVFALFFGVILVLQFLAMLVHRFGTFTHLMENTTLSCKLKQEDFDFDEDSTDNESDDDVDFEEERKSEPRKSIAPAVNPRRPSTAQMLASQEEQPEPFNNLEESYLANMRKHLAPVRDGPVMRKKSKKWDALRRRMSQDPRVMENLYKDDDTESTRSRTSSVRSTRTDSNVSNFTNRKYQRNFPGSTNSTRTGVTRFRPQHSVSVEERRAQEIPMSKLAITGHTNEAFTINHDQVGTTSTT